MGLLDNLLSVLMKGSQSNSGKGNGKSDSQIAQKEQEQGKQQSIPACDLDNLKQQLPAFTTWLGFYAQPALEVLKRFEIVRYYPASSGHHDSEVGGLYKHCLEVAMEMMKHPNAQKRNTRFAFLAFLTGLLHDVGKIGVFEYQTKYIFQPLTLQLPPQDLRVVGTKEIETQEYVHPILSVFLMYYFLEPVISILTPEEIVLIAEAVRLHHSNVVNENELLDLIRVVDKHVVRESVKQQVTDSSSIAQADPQQNGEMHPPVGNATETVEKVLQPQGRQIDLGILKTIIKKKIKRGDWIQDYHFYVTTFNDVNVILIAAPKTFHELCDEFCQATGMVLHDSMILDALEAAHWIAVRDESGSAIVKVRLKIQNSERNLKFVVLFADKVLNQEQTKACFTKAEKVKFVKAIPAN